LQDMRRDRQSRCPIYWAFRIDGIFHEMSQDKVYCATAKDLVEKYQLIFEVDLMIFYNVSAI